MRTRTGSVRVCDSARGSRVWRFWVWVFGSLGVGGGVGGGSGFGCLGVWALGVVLGLGVWRLSVPFVSFVVSVPSTPWPKYLYLGFSERLALIPFDSPAVVGSSSCSATVGSARGFSGTRRKRHGCRPNRTPGCGLPSCATPASLPQRAHGTQSLRGRNAAASDKEPVCHCPVRKSGICVWVGMLEFQRTCTRGKCILCGVGRTSLPATQKGTRP